MKSRDQNYNLGWTHVLSSKATFDVNAYARLAGFELFPSPGDTPVTATLGPLASTTTAWPRRSAGAPGPTR